MATNDVTSFTTVDHTGDPGFFLHFLDEANKLLAVSGWKPALLDGLKLSAGMKVLDAGCGAGEDALVIAPRIVPGGHVTGVDISESLIAEAVRRASARDLPVSFETGDAQELRFAEDTFDAVRCERMLMHVPDPERALTEMVRVLRPGGRIAIQDFDWETQFCDNPYKETTRKIALSFCDGLKNGWIGRRLPRLFREAGLSEVTTKFCIAPMTYEFLQLLLGGHITGAVQKGTLSAAEADRWWSYLAEANKNGTFLYGFTALVVSGMKPPRT